MKLLGFHNNKQIVASITQHDYRTCGGGDDYILMDGGQPKQEGWFGQKWGKKAWFEIPQTFAELYNDWNTGKPRKYGIWNLSEVKILSPEEYPDTNSFEWRAENEIWGTNGKDGKSPKTYVLIKDCELDHLEKISELLAARKKLAEEMLLPSYRISNIKEIVDFWIEKKKAAN